MFKAFEKNVYLNAPTVETFFRNIAKTVSNAAKGWIGYENIAKKLVDIPEKAYANAYKSFVPQSNGFNVLTHGDMFINNLLYRHDENGVPIDIRFVSLFI